MKTSHTRVHTASSNLFGALLLLSLLSTALISFNLDGLNDLYNTCTNQWHDFAESLTRMQPHQTVFPK